LGQLDGLGRGNEKSARKKMGHAGVTGRGKLIRLARPAAKFGPKEKYKE
jgi:hypothetical protein